MTDDLPANEHYIISGTKRLRCGFTTGTCAALAAQAATYAALTGRMPERVTLRTPKGWLVHAAPIAATAAPITTPSAPHAFRCGIRKDAGDDPDVTDGCIVYATVNLVPDASATVTVSIDGGAGVGRVTKPGLDQPAGSAAINSVPRAMIAEAVRTVCEQWGFSGSAAVCIDVPEGAVLAERTFNPQLGIIGGISILGTSGVVEPMSESALIETIDAELRIRASEQSAAMQTATPEVSANSTRPLIITPGNYGADFVAAYPALAALPCVKCSNFVGDALDRAIVHGFRHILLVGHAGKFVKLAGGIMNTHSRTADCRMELLCAHAALCGAPRTVLESIMQCATVDAAFDVLDSTQGLFSAVMQRIVSAAQNHITKRAGNTAATGIVMFTNVRGVVGMSEAAQQFLLSNSL